MSPKEIKIMIRKFFLILTVDPSAPPKTDEKFLAEIPIGLPPALEIILDLRDIIFF